MTDIVLVPGTTQSASGFHVLVEELGRLGCRALAVDVPSGAESSAEGYAELLAAGLPDDLERPVVAAHSASGLLLPALARRLDARHQVWLAAAVADHTGRRSLLAEIQHDPDAVFNPEWLGNDPAADPVIATYFLFHDADLATLREALSTVTRCDLSAVYASTPTEDPAGIPSTYLLPTGDRVLSPRWMDHVARQRLGIEPTTIPGGHNFYAAAPHATAALIAGAAA